MIGEETQVPALTDTFRSFVEQTGVPVLDVSLSCEAGDTPSVTIRQSRYKALGSPIEDGGKLWSIPVCVRSSTGRRCLIMANAEETLQLGVADCPQFVLPNAGGSGYYRWTLDESSWAALIENFPHLLPTEALSAVDSAFAAFEAGKLDEASLLAIVAASSRFRARQVIGAPLPHLAKYVQHYFSDAEQTAFLEFARTLYQPIVDRNAAGADGDSQLLYAELVSFMALTARDPDARKRLLPLAHAFTGFEVDRDADALHSDLYEAALTVAIQDSDAGFLPHLIEFRSALDDPLFEKASASAIGRVSDPDQLGTVHQLAFDDRLGPREVFDMVSTALSEPALRDRHWDWFRDRFPAIVDRVPAQWQRFTPGMATGFCDDDKLNELRELFEQHGERVAGHQRGLDQATEQIRLCIALRDRGIALASGISAYQVRGTSSVLRDQRMPDNGTHGKAAQQGENAGRAVR
jgi:alanyl aminopeptidase